MRQFWSAALAVMVLTVAVEAAGQDAGSGDDTPAAPSEPAPPERPAVGTIWVTTDVGLTPEQRACVLRCLTPQGSAEECVEARRHAREGWRRLLERLREIETRIGTLEEGYAGLTRRVAQVEDELERLRTELQTLREQLDELATTMVALEQRMGRVETLVGDQGRELQEAGGRIDNLEGRVTRLEERRWVTYRPGGLRFVSLWGNGIRYSGGIVSLGGVEFNFTPRFSVVLEGGLVADGSDRPIGTFVEGALAWDVRRPYGVWRLGVAFRGMWTGLDRTLHAEAAFVTAAPTVSFRFDRAQWLEIFVSVPAGIGIAHEAVFPVVGIEAGVAIRVEF